MSNLRYCEKCQQGYLAETGHTCPMEPMAAKVVDHCKKCGNEKTDWATCWSCGGEGGYHDCGEDTCCCIDKEEITHRCSECKGEGGWPTCGICAPEP